MSGTSKARSGASPTVTTPTPAPAPKGKASKSSTPSPDALPSTPPPLDVYGKDHRAAVYASVLGDSAGPRAAQPQYDWTKMPSTAKPKPKMDAKWWGPAVDRLAKPMGKDLARLAKPLSKITSVVGVDEKQLRKALKKAPKAALEAGLKKGVSAAVQPARDASVGPTNPTDPPKEIGQVQHFPGTPITITK